jgi:N-acetyl sugar amidotransferase
MKYCKKCLNTDTRPGTMFSNDGFCPVCKYQSDNEDLEWISRRDELQELVEFGKKHSSNGYDCIIGISGGKDSTRQALFVKNVLQMKPLLVCLAYPPDQVTQRGIYNLNNLIKNGFDCITIYPDPIVWKKLVKKGFFQYGNYLKACEIALFSSVPRFAIAHQIPLIWWGENSALQLGESAVMGETGYDGNNLRNMNTLGGGDITWMLDSEIRYKDILQHTYPTQEEMKKANLKITFLGYFWSDWSTVDNSIFTALNGIQYLDNNPLLTGDLNGTTALDDDWSIFNQGIKYLKYGFGRISDDVNEEIINGKITRNEGIKLLEKYDGKFSDKVVADFCRYLEISNEEFWTCIDNFVNKDLFTKVSLGKYERKFVVGKGLP